MKKTDSPLVPFESSDEIPYLYWQPQESVATISAHVRQDDSLDIDMEAYVKTWEVFSQLLRNRRQSIAMACMYSRCPDEAKKRLSQLRTLESVEGQPYIEMAQAAWKCLGDTKNRVMSLVALSWGVAGRMQSLLEGHVSVKGQQALYSKLQKARRRAEEAGRKFVAALEEYEQAAVSVVRDAPYPKFAFLNSSGRMSASQWTLTERSDRASKIALYKKEAEGIMEHLQGIVDKDQIVKRQTPGRHDNVLVNAAIGGLGGIFERRLRLTTYQAIHHTHSLLYAAGIWPNDNAREFTAKYYQVCHPKNQPKTTHKKAIS